MKLFILSKIPAPYRMAVFTGLAKVYDTTVFLERTKDAERSKDWFQEASKECWYDLLSEDEGRKKYEECIAHLKEYDLVLCYEPFTKEARRLERLCMCMRVPYVINIDGALKLNTNIIKSLVKRFYITHAAKCLAGSAGAEKYLRYYGASCDKIVRHKFTSMYADEIRKQPLSITEKEILKEQLGIRKIPTFITVGQFIPRKGFDLLIEAWKDVKEKNCQLLIIGGGGLRSQYEDMIKTYGLDNVFLSDFIPHEQLMNYFQACDFFIMPTREDIWGLVVNEAMSVGLPVISSDHCVAANELIENGINGFIYPLNATALLAQIIVSQLEDRSGYAELCCRALEAVADYTYENIIAKHIEVFEDVR